MVSVRSVFGAALLALAACATPGQPLPPTATPQQLLDRVAAFAQPTQDGRLSVSGISRSVFDQNSTSL